jgi:hypothetical protein
VVNKTPTKRQKDSDIQQTQKPQIHQMQTIPVPPTLNTADLLQKSPVKESFPVQTPVVSQKHTVISPSPKMTPTQKSPGFQFAVPNFTKTQSPKVTPLQQSPVPILTQNQTPKVTPTKKSLDVQTAVPNLTPNPITKATQTKKSLDIQTVVQDLAPHQTINNSPFLPSKPINEPASQVPQTVKPPTPQVSIPPLPQVPQPPAAPISLPDAIPVVPIDVPVNEKGEYQSSANRPPSIAKDIPMFTDPNRPVYRFDNPELAIKLLNLINLHPRPFAKRYSEPQWGIIPDSDYCDKSMSNFIQHPETVFLQQNFLVEYDNGTFPRDDVMKQIGNISIPAIGAHMTDEERGKATYPLTLDINSFYFLRKFHQTNWVGKQMLCPNQLYNHIIGIENLTMKGEIARSYQIYRKKEMKKGPQCFEDFAPEVYSFASTQQCKRFFKYLMTPEYAELKVAQSIVFMQKLGAFAHAGKGVVPFDDEQEKALRELYDNGEKCGEIRNYQILQKYIANPLLIEGHKFDFRIYMLIASVDPLILYYHDGFLRVSLQKYDIRSKDLWVHLTNAELAKDLLVENNTNLTWNNMTQEQLRSLQYWNFTRFGNYMLEKGLIKDLSWLETGLRAQIQKSMVHLMRAVEENIKRRSHTYEFFGIDFMLDADLKLWFIECNGNPSLRHTIPIKEEFIVKTLIEHFEVMYGYLRSRMKRLVLFVNEWTKEVNSSDDVAKIEPSVIKQKQKLYNKLDKNRLEPEFEPSKANGWVKVIDENLEGAQKYSNYIPKECL